MLQTLLTLGLGAVTKTELGVTPLMLACLEGRSDEAQMLLNWGAIPEDEDYLGRSVREYAVWGGDSETLTLLDQALIPWTGEPADGAPLP